MRLRSTLSQCFNDSGRVIEPSWRQLGAITAIQQQSTGTGCLIRSTQPSECGRQHTLISVHAQTASWQQSNGNSEAMRSEKCGEWRD